MELIRTITSENDGRTLGSYLKNEMRISSRLMKRLKTNNLIFLNGMTAYTNRTLHTGDSVLVGLSPLAAAPCESAEIVPEDIELEILYEDDALIAINKRAGRIVHPSVIEGSGTVSNALAHHYAVHGKIHKIHPISRLDRDTTGVILFAKDSYTGYLSCDAIARGQYQKQYLGVVIGTPEPRSGTIDLPIARVPGSIMLRTVAPHGQSARTIYETLHSSRGLSLLRLSPVTGRTHQLRVHLAAIGCPILCDGLYGQDGPSKTPPTRTTRWNKDNDSCSRSRTDDNARIYNGSSDKSTIERECQGLINRQALHSWKLTLNHPLSGKEFTITGAPPEDILELLKYMDGSERCL